MSKCLFDDVDERNRKRGEGRLLSGSPICKVPPSHMSQTSPTSATVVLELVAKLRGVGNQHKHAT